MNGMIEVNGRRYIKRQQVFTATLTVTVGLSTLMNNSLVLPGVADFLLEARTRGVIYNNAEGTNRFRYREGNTDNAQWYMAAGTGSTNDRVLDTLVFGNGAFPFPVVPGIFYSKSASILFDVEDLSNVVPYTIHFGWIGSYLIPVAS